jgi:hypothetical protein
MRFPDGARWREIEDALQKPDAVEEQVVGTSLKETTHVKRSKMPVQPCRQRRHDEP